MSAETHPSAIAATAQDLAAPGLPGETRSDSEAIPTAYARAFSLAAFTMNRFIVDHVIRASRHFDNDMEAMILFGTVAHLNAAHLMPPGASPTSVLGTTAACRTRSRSCGRCASATWRRSPAGRARRSAASSNGWRPRGGC